MLWPYIYIYIHFCEFSVISMHIRWKINDDNILTWNHPFPKDTLIGTSERAAVRLPASAVGAANVNYWQPKRLGLWVGCRHGAGPSEPVYLSKKLRLYVNNEWKQRKYTFVVCKGESASLKANQMKCLKFELLDGGTGHCTKSVYCGETNDEHCFVNPWNHGIELMGINSVYGLIHDARVCNFCIDCGMKTRLLRWYEFCAVMMMLCLLSPQSFTSLSLRQYV